MFFFANFEYLRQRETQSQIKVVPNALARQGIIPLAANAAPAPGCIVAAIPGHQNCGIGTPNEANFLRVKPYLDLFPLGPNQPGSVPAVKEIAGYESASFGDPQDQGNGTAQILINAESPGTEYFTVGRFDWNVSTKDSFFALQHATAERPSRLRQHGLLPCAGARRAGQLEAESVRRAKSVEPEHVLAEEYEHHRIRAAATTARSVQRLQPPELREPGPWMDAGRQYVGGDGHDRHAQRHGRPARWHRRDDEADPAWREADLLGPEFTCIAKRRSLNTTHRGTETPRYKANLNSSVPQCLGVS
jgi:hypothetical protein